MEIQLGLCCMNTVLRQQKPPVFSSRKMIIKSIQEKGIDTLKEKIIQNLKDTLTLMDWNEKHGIKVFRLSSELFPHKSNPKVEDYSFDFAIPYLKEIGKKSKMYGQRLTFHPGQYNVVGTPDEKTFQQTCLDLKYHADVLDLMDLDNNSVIVVHGGGIYGDKEKTIKRWCDQYYRLPENVQRRLVIENCEKCFSIKDCLKISIKTSIPVVFDSHHFTCYKKLHPDETFYPPEYYIKHLLPFWKRRNIKPKCHVSEQGSGRIGHHSDYVETIPSYLLEIPSRHNTSIDIMIEAKAKEQALFHLYKKYPYLNPLNTPVVLMRPGAGWTNKQPNCECGC
jgi:UV DNA damage endonuclease